MQIRNLLKNNKKIIIAFILGLIISGSGVYAATTASSDVSFSNNSQSTVQGAIDDLYSKFDSFIVQDLAFIDGFKHYYENPEIRTYNGIAYNSCTEMAIGCGSPSSTSCHTCDTNCGYYCGPKYSSDNSKLTLCMKGCTNNPE